MVFSGSAAAGSRELTFGPVGDWVKPATESTSTQPAPAAPYHLILLDRQIRFTAEASETYRRGRVKVLTPDGLDAGDLAFEWNPDTDVPTVHYVRILRDGAVIDALANQKFSVLRRERSLESSMLDGRLTATLQIAGLRVGDVVDWALTIRERDPVMAGRSQAVVAAPSSALDGRYRLRAVWPSTEAIRWKVTSDFGKPQVATTSDGHELNVEFDGLPLIPEIDGAPARYNIGRQVEFSEFKSWAEVAALMEPLFRQAATPKAGSPLKAEIDRIAAASDDPATRAHLALRLVQEQVRYVYVGLDNGAFAPASADQTWERRFGDCKGKTALLMALLNGLGVRAEPVFTHLDGADGMDANLPRVNAFDHVLVRAEIGGRTYWLDGTRPASGEPPHTPPNVRFVLPVRASGAELEAVRQQPPSRPGFSEVVEFDARRGLDQPVTVRIERVLTGDDGDGYSIRSALAGQSRAEYEPRLRSFWADEYAGLKPERVGWRYDAAADLVHLTFVGTTKLETRPYEGLLVASLPVSELPSSYTFERPSEQDQSAPFRTDFPLYETWSVSIRLPDDPKLGVGFLGQNVARETGGLSIRRRTSVEGRTVTSFSSRRTMTPEVTAAEAGEHRKRLEGEETAMVLVYLGDAKAVDKIDRLDRLKSDAPTETVVLYANAAAMRGDADEALRLYDRALRKDPNHFGALEGKAYALEASGRGEEALGLLEAALTRQPTREVAQVHARLLLELGRREESIKAIEAALSRYPDQGLMWLQLAHMRQLDGDEAGALAALAKARGKEDEDLRLRAKVLADLGREEEALLVFDEVLALDPDAPEAWMARSDMHYRSGRYDLALLDAEQALRLQPLSIEAQLYKINALDEAGRTDEALTFLDEALERTPQNTGLLNARCWTKAVLGRALDQAQADCDAALAADPEAGWLMDSRAFVSLRQERYDDAIKRYDAALAKAPDQAESLYGRGVAKIRSGDEAGGKADIAAALKLDPKAAADFKKAGLAI
jgi:tetratricopeptide (TPR) repeat protein/transglutaminase-like putative cysteine protease